jgi:hypothetical protein
MATELNTIAPKKWVANYSGAAPTIDITDGVSVGDFAIDSSNDAIWRCTDNTDTAAVWASVGGKVLQVVTVESAQVSTAVTIPADDTIPQNTEGAEVLTLAITPKSATSKLYFQFVSHAQINGSNSYMTFAVFVDSDASAIKSQMSMSHSVTNLGLVVPLIFSVPSVSKTTRTYKVRMGPVTGTMYNYSTNAGNDFGGTKPNSVLTIMEVEA